MDLVTSERRKTVFKLVVKILNLDFVDIEVEFHTVHTGPRVLKACLALPILLFISSSTPPSDVRILPKNVKL